MEPGDGREIFLIGGAQLYAALLPACAELLLTLVKREVFGDVFFPRFEDRFHFEEILQRPTNWRFADMRAAHRHQRMRPSQGLAEG